MPALTNIYVRTLVECVPCLTEKYWWSVLVPHTTSPIHKKITSGLLHIVLHLMIYNIKQAYEFVCNMGNFLKPETITYKFVFIRVVFIDDIQTCFNFEYIYLKTFTFQSLPDEVVSFERVHGTFSTELIMLRQQHENL